jgi:hypothetical protein
MLINRIAAVSSQAHGLAKLPTPEKEMQFASATGAEPAAPERAQLKIHP